MQPTFLGPVGYGPARAALLWSNI